MPKVLEESIKLRLPKSHGRSVGLHLSEIIRDLAFNTAVLDEKYRTEVALDEQDTHMMQLGLAWEDYLEKSEQFPDIEFHPGELKARCGFCAFCGEDSDEHLESDHVYKELVIYMSPDGFGYAMVADALFFLAEVKLTKKSCRNFAQGIRMRSKKSAMWIWQIAGYLYGLWQLDPPLKSLVAKLFVMFVNGNYSYKMDDPDGGAVKKCFTLIFDEEEVEENWRRLRNHARVMIREGRWVCPKNVR